MLVFWCLFRGFIIPIFYFCFYKEGPILLSVKYRYRMLNEGVIFSAVFAVAQGHQIIFGDDFDDEKPENTLLEKVDNFAEEVVPRFNDLQFKRHFRITVSAFEDLLNKLHRVTAKSVTSGHPEISLEKQALITLWCLSNTESFRCVSDRFGISKSTCWAVLYRTSLKILDMNRAFKVICWPSRRRALNIMQEFQTINGLEGVIGCIDGSHIRILPPREHPNSYCNRKGFHSILLQGVCDNSKLFTHVYTGECGSMHDNRLFEKSDLFRDIGSGEVKFPAESFLIGDLAYKLTEYLIVGFKNTGFLTQRQINFNQKLSQVRVKIENAFALLKGRFRRLKFLETVRLDLTCLLIISACILHDICLLNGDEADDIIDIARELNEERVLNDGNNVIQINPNRLAVAKRQRLMERLEMNENNDE